MKPASEVGEIGDAHLLTHLNYFPSRRPATQASIDLSDTTIIANKLASLSSIMDYLRRHVGLGFNLYEVSILLQIL